MSKIFRMREEQLQAAANGKTGHRSYPAEGCDNQD